MFNFPKVAVEDLDKRIILPAGIYFFRIDSAELKKSKQGNQMIELRLTVSTDSGESAVVFDYIVSMDKMAWKCHHLCCSIGHEELYTEGTVNADFLKGKGGQLQIEIDNKDPLNVRNRVKDYIKPEEGSSKDSSVEPTLNDDIPF